MPITQDRMIAVIQAAKMIDESVRELKRTLESMDEENQTKTIPRSYELMRSKDQDEVRKGFKQYLAVYDELINFVRHFHVPEAAIVTIVKEETHFMLRRSVNERNRISNRMHRAREKSHNETIQEEVMFADEMQRINEMFKPQELTPEEQDAKDIEDCKGYPGMLEFRRNERKIWKEEREKKEQEKSQSQPAPIQASEIPQSPEPETEIIDLNEELDESDPNFEVRNQRLKQDRGGNENRGL